jgi:chemotaxis regulatin CheY-phosphate phosphatase CheZ
MTQEELDALMNGEMDLDALEETENEPADETEAPEEAPEVTEEGDRYRASAKHAMPPPVTDDHKMVHQLDDVTKESEEKASEIFDIIEGISNELMEHESRVLEARDVLESNVDLFETLSAKFPEVAAFGQQLKKNRAAFEELESLEEVLQRSGDSIMNVMDIMQYQDIHRQKIERVINVMRALSGYLNNLFAGKKEDDERVSSATHLPGDLTTEDVVSNDDIEALLASLGKN